MRLALIAPLLLSFSLAGPSCVLHTKERSQASERSERKDNQGRKKDERCRPSHDWDSDKQKCVHRGRGKGARKHDY